MISKSRRRLPRRVLLAGLVALASLAAGQGWLPDKARAASPPAGTLDLAAYKGKVVYLDFWASWCGPCQRSFPYMTDLMYRYGRGNFIVVAVNVDHDKGKAAAFLDHFRPQFPIVYDPTGKVARTFNVRDMPTSVLIDANGHTRFTHSGFFEADEPTYNRQIEGLLHEIH